MAWSFVGVSTTVTATASPIVLTMPAGTQEGDLLIAHIAYRIASTTAITKPADWILAATDRLNNDVTTTTSSLSSAMMAYCVKGPTDPGLSFAFPTTPSIALGTIVAYRGNAPTNVLNVAIAANAAANTTALNATGVTTTTTDALLVAAMAGGSAGTWSVYKTTTPGTAASGGSVTTAPSDTTWKQRAGNTTTTGADTAQYIYDALKVVAGATGNQTATISSGARPSSALASFKQPVLNIENGWSQGDKIATVVLSGHDKIAAGLTTTGVRSTKAYLPGTAGKYYGEVCVTGTTPSACRIGIAPITNALTATTANMNVNGTNGSIFVNAVDTTLTVGATALVANDVICIAWDAGAELIWFRKNGGNWNNNATHDPATGVGGISCSFAPNTVYHALSATFTGTLTATIRTQVGEFTQSVPSGFAAWAPTHVDAPIRGVDYLKNPAWTAGATTTMSIAGGKARATATDSVANNPRLAKTMTGLTIGRVYEVSGGNVYMGTTPTPQVYVRVSDTVLLDAASSRYNVGETADADPQSFTFTATQTTHYFGFIPVCNANGQYGELTDTIQCFEDTPVGNDVGMAITCGSVTVSTPAGGPDVSVNVTSPGALTVTLGNESVVGKANAVIASVPGLTSAVGTVYIPTAYTTLNPLDKKNVNVVLSNGNLTVSGSDVSNNWVRSTTAKTGKRYVEFTTTTVANSINGISDLSALTYPGADAHSFGQFANGAGSINGTFPAWGPTYASGDVLGMAVDLTAKLVWYRVGAGSWNAGGTANPATGVGGWDISLYTGTPHHLVVSGDTGMVTTVNFGGTAFANTAPAAFIAWDAVPAVDVSVNVTGNALTISQGDETVVGKANATISMLANGMTATLGDESVTANQSVSTTISAVPGMTITAGTATASAVIHVSTNVTGNALAISLGDETVVIEADVAVTMSSLNISLGNESVTGIANVAATSPPLVITLGDAFASVPEIAEVSGFELDIDIGDASVSLPKTVNVSGNFMLASLGSVAVAGGAGAVVTAMPALTSSLGNENVIGTANVDITGIPLAITLGDEVASGNAIVAVTSPALLTVGLGDEVVRLNTAIPVSGFGLTASTANPGGISVNFSISVIVTGFRLTVLIGSQVYVPQASSPIQREGIMKTMANMMGN